jgi:hypothetical protein
MTYLPRIIIFNKAATDPFAGGAGLYTFTMTNSVDTWEQDGTYTYTNSTSKSVTLIVRAQGMNATGNVFSEIKATQINVDLTTLLANVAVIDGIVDALAVSVADLPTNSELATALDPLPTAVENAAAVLAAAVLDPIDVNIQEVNDVELKGDGSTVPWGPV